MRSGQKVNKMRDETVTYSYNILYGIYKHNWRRCCLVVVTSNQKRKQTGKIKKPKWKQKVKKNENTLLPHPAGAEKVVVCADEVGRVIMASADH